MGFRIYEQRLLDKSRIVSTNTRLWEKEKKRSKRDMEKKSL